MKTLLHSIIVLSLLLIISSCSNDDDAPTPNISGEYTTAEALLETHGFQGSVLIRKGGTDFMRKGFGIADAGAGIANDPSLVYRIGSMTKAFTTMGIINLKRDGLIESFDQPLSDFDDEFPHGDKITLRHLMTHYSGLPDYIGVIEEVYRNQNLFFTAEEIYDIIKESAGEDGLLYEPGSNFSYSNSGYLILGLLIEELTDMDYDDYIGQNVMTPLGMNQTGKGADDIQGAGFAKGYKDGQLIAPYLMELANSAGEFESTIADLEKWGDALMGNELLTANEKADYFAAPYTEDDFFTSGFGWFTIKIDGTLVYNHGGNIDGFTSIIALLPETNSMIILLSNVENWSPVNEVLEALVVNEF
ncbi:serine hydrolase domain-containing protein [Roseivirga misakiensis]|uniref:Serine hydrolase n=1 Tax=Roseivirga misakiensis TaxID=1563681 RepID=A0A1E5SY36_9BACT|nr:serine hydrolase domain-containing protein [Roseivirga misakiensis]OEK04038.1 serine hydrolase [Roseivirga misakiensis]